MAADRPSSPPLPPGHWGLPFLGETLQFFADPKFAEKRHQQYGDVFKTRLLGTPTVFLRGAIANRFIFTDETQRFTVTWPPSTKALLGSLSLALQTGATHQSRRKLLAQAFMPRALSGYMATMATITHQYLQRWQQQDHLTWYPELRNYTFDVACKLLVGFDQGSQTPLGHWFETWCQGLFSIPLNLPWTRFGKAMVCRRQLLKELERIILDRQNHPPSSHDALGLLITAEDDNGDRLSLDELKEQVLLLLFAGHETLTSAIASFCLLVAQHPDVVEKLRWEQHHLPADLTLDTLKQMTYLEQVLQEVMRLVPPVGGGFRKVIHACEFSGYHIPEGWNVLYQINTTHQDGTLYPNPDQFNPDRFRREEMGDRQKYGYLPFGGGIRECLGKEFARLEMKVFAACLLRGYTWELLPDQDLSMITVPTPHPRDGLKVKVRSLEVRHSG